MAQDTDLSALPEAIPLRSVSPKWRLLAILVMLAAALLLLLVAILGVALLSAYSESPGQISARTVTSSVPIYSLGGDPADIGEGRPVDDPRNSPYPLRADLAASERKPVDAPRDTAARQFLQLGQEVWRGHKNLEPEHISVSSNGTYLATIYQGRLLAGRVKEGFTVALDGDRGELIGAGLVQGTPRGTADQGGPPGPSDLPPAGGSRPGEAPSREPVVSRSIIGMPAWPWRGPEIRCATDGGRILQCRLEAGTEGFAVEELPLWAEMIATVPFSPERLILVRSKAVPKLEVPGEERLSDPTEVVLRNLPQKSERLLVAAGRATWKYPAVSPDQTRLAIVSNRGHEDKTSPLWQVFVFELAGGAMRPVTPPAPAVGTLCWTSDSRGLILARSQQVSPPDHWDEIPTTLGAALDLYHLDLTTGKETRLTRGGGFFSPSMDFQDFLYYLTSRREDAAAPVLTLRRMPLQAALKFAKEQPEGKPRSAEAWIKVIEGVLADSGLSPTSDGAALTPEVLAQAADTFARRYQEAFGQKAPANLNDLGRQRQELGSLPFSREARPKVQVTLGIVEGEFLRRQHGARWRLTKGPLLSPEPGLVLESKASLFVCVGNPSHDAGLLQAAEGRPLVLSNDPSRGEGWLHELTDGDLARGEELLRSGKTEEGERVLREMLQREAHANNAHLVLHVGKFLYEQKRYATLVDLMKRQARKAPLQAGKYNLLGLAQMESNTGDAIDSFRTALRHDLHYGPAYLNLAQAYQRRNNTPSALLCLRRYLQLEPQGPFARDAQRRLSELQATVTEPPNTMPPGAGAGEGPR